MIYERVNGISEMEMQNPKSDYELKKQTRNRKKKSEQEFQYILECEMKKIKNK
jgi:hypothetical protein